MVQINFLTAATIAALFSTVIADNCRTQYTYCGSSLLGMGNYREQIKSALRSKGRGTAEIDIQESLFRCKGGDNGDIEFMTFCRGVGCWNRGRGYNDECFSYP